MIKVIRLQDLECACCAQKMEDAVKKINGINSVSVNFLSQKMTIDADENLYNDIIKKIKKSVKKIEPYCKVIAE